MASGIESGSGSRWLRHVGGPSTPVETSLDGDQSEEVLEVMAEGLKADIGLLEELLERLRHLPSTEAHALLDCLRNRRPANSAATLDNKVAASTLEMTLRPHQNFRTPDADTLASPTNARNAAEVTAVHPRIHQILDRFASQSGPDPNHGHEQEKSRTDIDGGVTAEDV